MELIESRSCVMSAHDKGRTLAYWQYITCSHTRTHMYTHTFLYFYSYVSFLTTFIPEANPQALNAYRQQNFYIFSFISLSLSVSAMNKCVCVNNHMCVCAWCGVCTTENGEGADKNIDRRISSDTLCLTLLLLLNTKPLLPWQTQAHWIYPDSKWEVFPQQ